MSCDLDHSNKPSCSPIAGVLGGAYEIELKLAQQLKIRSPLKC